MVGKTELILICLVAVALLAIVAQKIRVPYPILLTVGGGVLALVPGLPAIHLDPQLVFNLFLPPLLYPAAVYTSWRDFRANLRSILPLAIFLVLLTMTGTAYVFHALTGLPLAVGFVFGALISPPDAVAALAMTKARSASWTASLISCVTKRIVFFSLCQMRPRSAHTFSFAIGFKEIAFFPVS